MKHLLLIGLCAAAAAAAGCKKTDEKEAEAPPPAGERLPDSEAQLGRQACEAYVAQVCACAPAQPELKGECDMAKARPEAFQLNTRAALAQGDADGKDRRAMIANARKIMRSCIEDAAALAKRGCPMAAAPPPAGESATPAPGAPAEPAPAPAK